MNKANIRQKLKEFGNIEDSFFDIDHERKICHLKLFFKSPDEIFDANVITKTPVFNDDFTDWLLTLFDYTPKNYKLDVDVCFDDLSIYSEDQLQEIYHRNLMLEYKRIERKTIRKNRIAFILLGSGIISFIAMLLFQTLWTDGGVLKETLSYIFDIATTVTFWEALTILIVENAERRNTMLLLASTFQSIAFCKKQDD